MKLRYWMVFGQMPIEKWVHKKNQKYPLFPHKLEFPFPFPIPIPSTKMKIILQIFTVFLTLCCLWHYANGQLPTFFVRYKGGPFQVLNNRGLKICESKKNAPLEAHHKIHIDTEELNKIATECKLFSETESLEFHFSGMNGKVKGNYQIKFDQFKVNDLRGKIEFEKKKHGHVVILFNLHLGLVLEVDNWTTVHEEGIRALAKFDEIAANVELKAHYKENLQENAKQWQLDALTLWDFGAHIQAYITRGVEGRFVSDEMQEMEKKMAAEKQALPRTKTGRQHSRRHMPSMNRSASVAQKQAVHAH